MKVKRSLGSRIRGWFPKENSLPNQTSVIFNVDRHFELVRLAYGVMLGSLLIMPFGVYHSTAEPYITGSLWGYYLPIGYVGFLLGIMVVFYQRLSTLRNLRFSALMLIIGLSLLFTFIFAPNDYFINLLHGTSFSPNQIDVDFILGNSAVLGLSILSIVVSLVSFATEKRVTNRGLKSRM
jgi:hypothetical protein